MLACIGLFGEGRVVRGSTKFVLGVLSVGMVALVLGWLGVLSESRSSSAVAACLVLALVANVREAVVRERERGE